MTTITLSWRRGCLVGLRSEGHSGVAKKGEDVVCAAVSSLVHALLLGLSDVAHVESVECRVEPDVPMIEALWSFEEASSLEVLTSTVALSLKNIAEQYPDYVHILEVQR